MDPAVALVPWRAQDIARHHAFLPREDEYFMGTRRAVTETLTFGSGDLGELGRERGSATADVPKLRNRTVIDIACGPASTVFLTNTGEMYVCGSNEDGELIAEDERECIEVATVHETLSSTHRIAAVAAGMKHTGAVVAGSQLPVTFGSNEYHALGHSSDKSSPFRVSPRVMRGLPPGVRVAQLAFGTTHSIILTRDGAVYSCGSGIRGALGHGDTDDRQEACRVLALGTIPIAQIAAGDNSSHAVSVTGAAYAWGLNRHSQLGLKSDGSDVGAAVVLSPRVVESLPELVTLVVAGESHTAWVSKSGRLYTAGRNNCGQCGVGLPVEHGGSAPGVIDTPTEVPLPDAKRVREVAAGSRHTLILTVDSQLYALGDCSSGATGITLDTDGKLGAVAKCSPPEDALEDATATAAAVAAVDDRDGLDLQWARGSCVWKPTHIPSLSSHGIFRIAAGGDHSAAIRVVRGSVLSTAPGALPRGALQMLDTVTLTRLAKYATDTQNFAPLKSVIRDVLAHAVNVNGSFLCDNEAVLMETRSPAALAQAQAAAATATQGERPAHRLLLPSPGSQTPQEQQEVADAAMRDSVSVESLIEALSPRAHAAESISSSSSGGAGGGDAGSAPAAAVAAAAASMEDVPPAPITASANADVSADSDGSTPAAKRRAVAGSGSQEGTPQRLPVHTTSDSDGADTPSMHDATVGAEAGAMAGPAAATEAEAEAEAVPPPRLRLRKGSEADAAMADEGNPDAAALMLPPVTPKHAPRTPFGLPSCASVRLAPLSVSGAVSRTVYEHSSGIDVQGLETAYTSVLASYNPDVTLELIKACASSIEELEQRCLTMLSSDGIRALLTLWLCPVNSKASASAAIITRLCVCILSLPQRLREQLFRWIAVDVNGVLFASRLLRPLAAHIAYHMSFIMGGQADAAVCKSYGPAVAEVFSLPGSAAARDGKHAAGGAGGAGGASSAGGAGGGGGGSGAAATPADYKVVTHLGALELLVRVMRLLYMLNDRLATEAQAAVGTHASAGASAGGGSGSSSTIPLPVRVSSSARDASTTPLGALVPFEEFYSKELSELPDKVLALDYQRWATHGYKRVVGDGGPIVLCEYPFLLDPGAKRRVLGLEAMMQMSALAQQAMARSFFHATGEQPYLVLEVRRSHLLRDTLNQLSAQPPEFLKKQLKVVFVGEEAIDAGGVTKELMQLLVRELFGADSPYGLFTYNPETREHWFNAAALPDTADEYFLVGLLVGLAIYNQVLLDFHAPLPLYRKLLGLPMSLFDLRAVRPSLAAGLEQLLAYPGDDVEDVFCLSFEASYEAFGEVHTVELVPGGKDKPVTSANKHEYVKRYVSWVLNDSIAVPFKHFQRGFSLILNGPSLSIFRPEELELAVCGTPHLDLHELQAVTQYEGYSAEHPVIQAFWRVVHAMSHAEQRQLLLFVTGSAKAPIGGLSRLPFKIQRAGPDSNQLPTASTCFNILLLPDYSSEEKLRNRLLTAIQECSGFGLK